jgi:hypothetical protein
MAAAVNACRELAAKKLKKAESYLEHHPSCDLKAA